jgi:hypothetical protein
MDQPQSPARARLRTLCKNRRGFHPSPNDPPLDQTKGKNSRAPRRVANRSVPPPLMFDPSTLPDNAVLTAKELAGWLRLALSTLSDWRSQHPDRGPNWVLVADKPRYRMGDVRRWLHTDRVARFGPPVFASPEYPQSQT